MSSQKKSIKLKNTKMFHQYVEKYQIKSVNLLHPSMNHKQGEDYGFNNLSDSKSMIDIAMQRKILIRGIPKIRKFNIYGT